MDGVEAELLIGALLGGAAPVLMLPRWMKPHTLGKRVLIAWKGTPEAARAVKGAARRHGENEEGLEQLEAYLTRHGARVEPQMISWEGAEKLFPAEIDDFNADLVSMKSHHFRWGRVVRRSCGSNITLVTVAVFATFAAWLSAPQLQSWFARFFGALPAALCFAALGGIALPIAPQLKRAGFWGVPRTEAVVVVAMCVLGFGALIVAVDRLIGLPAGINAPLPWALLYYAAMGFAAQVALHLLPLAAILQTAPSLAQRRPWAVMAMSATPEAALQGLSVEGAMTGIIGLHLMGFGVAEIYLLRRFGFLAMYAFRMGYYLLWHVAWGAVRGG